MHDSIEESLEQGKLEFRDAKSGSVSSVGQTGGREEGGGEHGREVGWGRGQETEENAAVRAEGGGDMAVGERARGGTRGRNIYCHLLYHLPTDSLPELVNTS